MLTNFGTIMSLVPMSSSDSKPPSENKKQKYVVGTYATVRFD